MHLIQPRHHPFLRRPFPQHILRQSIPLLHPLINPPMHHQIHIHPGPKPPRQFLHITPSHAISQTPPDSPHAVPATSLPTAPHDPNTHQTSSDVDAVTFASRLQNKSPRLSPILTRNANKSKSTQIPYGRKQFIKKIHSLRSESPMTDTFKFHLHDENHTPSPLPDFHKRKSSASLPSAHQTPSARPPPPHMANSPTPSTPPPTPSTSPHVPAQIPPPVACPHWQKSPHRTASPSAAHSSPPKFPPAPTPSPKTRPVPSAPATPATPPHPHTPAPRASTPPASPVAQNPRAPKAMSPHHPEME